MADPTVFLRRHFIDILFIGIPAAGAVACWWLGLPLWMLVVCLVFLGFAIISFLGDLGLFGGADPD
ncbi:MAG: hypothetical protein KJO55_01105 [Gammaproteobacteria bacterium]|nr:hypothetical protein [Gammaproteobacteria bacterium]NND58823.1 hypothetical protein [Gammaproteobacteria bacterium]